VPAPEKILAVHAFPQAAREVNISRFQCVNCTSGGDRGDGDREQRQVVGQLQPGLVDVVHDQRERPEVVVRQQITQELSGEDGRARAHEADRRHGPSMPALTANEQEPACNLIVSGLKSALRRKKQRASNR
jgi:hypothetical protein